MRLAIGLMAIGLVAFGLTVLGAGVVSAQQSGSTSPLIQAMPIADTVIGSDAVVPYTFVNRRGHRGVWHRGWRGGHWRGGYWGGWYPYSYSFGYWPKRYYRGYQTCWSNGWNWYCGY